MASSVAGHVRAFGEDVVPGCYEDLEEADLVVHGRQQHGLVPSGALPAPDGGARERAAPRSSSSIRAAPRPRRPPTCICRWRPAPTSLLLNGLLVHLADTGALDRDWIAAHVDGLRGSARRGAALGAVARRRRRGDRLDGRRPARVSTTCSPGTERVVTLYSQGVNQSIVRHRQGQRHHQLPSGDRPHRPPRHGAVLAHRPAQRDGRDARSAALPTSLPRI